MDWSFGHSTMSTSHQLSPCELHKERHVRYWLRCLNSVLPTEYTSNDSSRLALAFFIISALDLLGVLHTHTTSAERDQFINWIYHCQHLGGGFRGSPITILGQLASDKNAQWDSASLPNSYFALATLVILSDSLERVQRQNCLTWLKQLQRGDGSFGAELGEHGRIEGGRDLRFCYWAAGFRWLLLGGNPESVETAQDVNVDALVGFISSSEVR